MNLLFLPKTVHLLNHAFCYLDKFYLASSSSFMLHWSIKLYFKTSTNITIKPVFDNYENIMFSNKLIEICYLATK